MFVPLAHMRYFGAADLMLNNRGAVGHSVIPTWYVDGRGTVVGDAINLPPNQATFHAIDEFLPAGVRLAQIQGLTLSYMGRLREVWAQVSLRPKQGAQPAQSLDSPFNMAQDFKSNRLETVWPVGRRNQRGVMALANTSAIRLHVSVASSDGTSELDLPPHSGRSVEIDVNERPLEAAWVRLESDGTPGSLRASGFVFSPTDKIPELTRFFDPAAPAQEKLFTTGLPVRDMAVTIALKNTAASPVTATVHFLDPTTGLETLSVPSVQIPAGRAIVVRPDISGLAALGRVGVRVDNSGGPGSLIGTLHGINTRTSMAYEMPLRDSGGVRASTGGYPWRIDGDYETRVSITNVGAVPTRFGARLQYNGTYYVFRTQELAVGATVVFDVRALRDGRVPDAFGRKIPVGLDHGQFNWSIHDSRPGAHLSGRAEIVSENEKVSSSYSCWRCCPDSIMSEYLDIGSAEVSVGGSTWLQPYANEADCWNNTWSSPTYTNSWSYNSNVLSLSGEYSIDAVGSGSTTIHAYWDGDEWADIPEHDEIQEHCESTPHYADAYAFVQTNYYNPTNVRLVGPGVEANNGGHGGTLWRVCWAITDSTFPEDRLITAS